MQGGSYDRGISAVFDDPPDGSIMAAAASIAVARCGVLICVGCCSKIQTHNKGMLATARSSQVGFGPSSAAARCPAFDQKK